MLLIVGAIAKALFEALISPIVGALLTVWQNGQAEKLGATEAAGAQASQNAATEAAVAQAEANAPRTQAGVVSSLDSGSF
jgi:hypothetical protein